jgi:hypothetical protein
MVRHGLQDPFREDWMGSSGDAALDCLENESSIDEGESAMLDLPGLRRLRVTGTRRVSQDGFLSVFNHLFLAVSFRCAESVPWGL